MRTLNTLQNFSDFSKPISRGDSLPASLKDNFSRANSASLQQQNSQAMAMPSPSCTSENLYVLEQKNATWIRSNLDTWACEHGISDVEFAQRQRAATSILKSQLEGGELYLPVDDDDQDDHYQELTSLPAGLIVRGDLWMSHLSKLRFLPEGLSVRGNCNLQDCIALESLPKNFVVEGALALDRCIGLKDISDGLVVDLNLYLNGCTGLTNLDRKFSCGGSIQLMNCVNLISLPPNLYVQGSLILSGCIGLTSLPPGLNVSGNLKLDGCYSLQSLPDDLIVKGNLNLCGCLGLKNKIPKSLQHRVGGKILTNKDGPSVAFVCESLQ